jgi:hypothetical protein
MQKLSSAGVAFIHHSNFQSVGDNVSNLGARGTTVSAEKVAQIITSSGGKVLIQEMLNWSGSLLDDCFTLFGSTKSYADIDTIYLRNNRFQDEASAIKCFQSHYSHIKIRAR